uniref:CASP-like protein n=2 Tax=Hordeum vulgare subsp. vulgare TaxID=112509 RepID=A0A8I6X3L4_HORVV
MSALATTLFAAMSALTLKLLIDKKANRVLYAEAGSDVVDFLFGLLAMPICIVAKELETGSDGVGVANIYASVPKMDDAGYMHSSVVQEALLSSHRQMLLQCPTIRVPYCPLTTTTTLPAAPSMRASVNGTPSYPQQYTSVATPRLAPTSKATDVARGFSHRRSTIDTGGYVQSLVTYTIMDDLTITPMSNISALALITKLNREKKDLVLEEKSVKIGEKEALDILKASVNSSTVLTDVFLSNNNTDVSLSKNKRAHTSNGEKKKDKIPDYYI